MDEVNEIAKRIRNLTTSKRKALIDTVFTIKISEEGLKEEDKADNNMITINNERRIPSLEIKLEEIPENMILDPQNMNENRQVKLSEEKPVLLPKNTQKKNSTGRYSIEYKKEAVSKALEYGNNRYIK